MPNLDFVRAKIVAVAKSQLGVPYVYGGTTPGVGWDCSGLAQWACAQVGIAVPRGSAAQFTASGPRVDGDIQPGDLVFFYGGEATGPRPGHVGIATSSGSMIDAPYTGTVVRNDSFTIVAHVGPLDFWGATRPAALAISLPSPRSGPTLCSVNLRVLSEGDTGQTVKALQGLLNVFDVAELAIDGDFGKETKIAVTTYQDKHGLTPDGIVGQQTWQALLVG